MRQFLYNHKIIGLITLKTKELCVPVVRIAIHRNSDNRNISKHQKNLDRIDKKYQNWGKYQNLTKDNTKKNQTL